jgi:hypothetical protein
MLKRFLNVNYKGTKTRINVAEMDDLSEVQDAIKARLSNTLSHVDAPQIQLYDNEHNHINTWADFNSLPADYFTEGGSCVDVHTTPPPSRQPSGAELLESG